ncbi:hypothetical protein V7128_16675 [Neobacillus vireti]|uniref:hypothetical protein n=1 Tax=Neobacillus vireti TaxID=220686 RepID=UPI002FFFB28C
MMESGLFFGLAELTGKERNEARCGRKKIQKPAETFNKLDQFELFQLLCGKMGNRAKKTRKCAELIEICTE